MTRINFLLVREFGIVKCPLPSNRGLDSLRLEKYSLKGLYHGFEQPKIIFVS